MTNLRWLWLVTISISIILAISDLFVITVSLLLLIFAGMVFGVFLNGLSVWLQRYVPIPYIGAYLVVVTLLALLLGAGFIYLGSQIAERADELWSQLLSSLKELKGWLAEQPWAERYMPDSSQLQSALTKSSGTLVPGIVSWLSVTGWGLTSALVILFVGLYAAYDPELYRSGLLKLFQIDKRVVASEVLVEIRSDLGRWIVGRFASMAVVGLLTAIGLWILGVPLPATLGVVAAFLTFVPNIGPLMAAVPQILLALNVGNSVALYVLVFNIVLQGVESYLITPIIQRHEVSLPPILLISAQVLMGVTFGVIGIMMAAPLTVVIIVLVRMLYVEKTLGDRSGSSAED